MYYGCLRQRCGMKLSSVRVGFIPLLILKNKLLAVKGSELSGTQNRNKHEFGSLHLISIDWPMAANCQEKTCMKHTCQNCVELHSHFSSMMTGMTDNRPHAYRKLH